MSRDYRITRPLFRRDSYPDAERRSVRALSFSINRLADFVDQFAAAVDLFDMASLLGNLNFLNRQFHMWCMIAAKDGAMTLYHFERVLTQSGKAFKDCPEFRKLVDYKALAAARRHFAEAFPHIVRVRHSVGHSAEMTETSENVSKNAYTGDFSETGLGSGFANAATIHNNLNKRIFTTTHEGKVVSYSISEATSDKIAEITSQFYDAFRWVDLNTPHERRRSLHE